jgi:hypothetical protein
MYDMIMFQVYLIYSILSELDLLPSSTNYVTAIVFFLAAVTRSEPRIHSILILNIVSHRKGMIQAEDSREKVTKENIRTMR